MLCLHCFNKLISNNLITGITLSESNASVTWDVSNRKENDNDKLIITLILLGREAKEGEFNVVEVSGNI